VPLQKPGVRCFQQRRGYSAGPEVDVAAALGADRILDRDVGDLDPPAGGEHAEDLGEDGVLSGIRSITPFEITTSKLASGKGSCSASLSTNSTFAAPISAAAARAFVNISGVMSMPVTWPCSPTICAATSESGPAPAGSS
jgi:hypothetical protein